MSSVGKRDFRSVLSFFGICVHQWPGKWTLEAWSSDFKGQTAGRVLAKQKNSQDQTWTLFLRAMTNFQVHALSFQALGRRSNTKRKNKISKPRRFCGCFWGWKLSFFFERFEWRNYWWLLPNGATISSGIRIGICWVRFVFCFLLCCVGGLEAMSQLDMVVSCCGAWNGQVQNERSIAESEARPRSPRRA